MVDGQGVPNRTLVVVVAVDVVFQIRSKRVALCAVFELQRRNSPCLKIMKKQKIARTQAKKVSKKEISGVIAQVV
jgi:hypothetical protein